LVSLLLSEYVAFPDRPPAAMHIGTTGPHVPSSLQFLFK
jgi:hypothetical protein